MTVMTASPPPLMQFNQGGIPLSGGRLYTYAAGTTTKITTYVDNLGVTPNTNPILLNTNGECSLWLDPSVNYKLTLSPSTDTDPPTNPFWTVDNISGGISSTSLNNLITGYATTATSATTTTLTTNSQYQQYFTGTTTQTVVLPDVTTLTLGRKFLIENNSTGIVTVNSFGGNLVASVPALTNCVVTCILITGATAASWDVVRVNQNKNELTSVTATIATGKLTLGLQPCVIAFRNSDVTNGVSNTKFINSSLTLATDNNGASFGLITAVQGRLIILAIDNGTATPVLGVINLSGGNSLTEEGVLTSTTAITGAVVSPSTVYTTIALGAGLYPYKVVGAVDITWTSGSGYITTPALVIGAGGNALSAMSSLGYGQTWQTVTRNSGTTYYSGSKPRQFIMISTDAATTFSATLTVGGYVFFAAGNLVGQKFLLYSIVIPPYTAYSYTLTGGAVAVSELI